MTNGADTMNNSQTRKHRLAALRAVQFTFGPYAVSCIIRNPHTGATLGYGIAATQAKAAKLALDSLAQLA